VKRANGAATVGNRDDERCTGDAFASVDLQRELLRRSSALAVRARVCRARGEVSSAARLSGEAARLRRVARDMRRDPTQTE
jgi:hypothetical protein